MNHELPNQEILKYIAQNPVMVLGTVDRAHQPYGAAVYACSLSGESVYFITKSGTKKYQNLQQQDKVSITFVNTQENSTLQAIGDARVIEDAQVIGDVMQHLTEIYAKSADWLPPITKLRAGPYEVIEVVMSHARLAHFMGAKPGSERIFTER